MAGSQQWGVFKIGDQVVITTASPSDRPYGKVQNILSERCGPGSHQKAEVLHENGDTSTWDVDELAFAVLNGRTTREYLRSLGVPETRDQAWIVDQTRTIRALRKERGGPPPGCIDVPWTPEEESEVDRRLRALGVTKPANKDAPALSATEIADLPPPGWDGKYTDEQMDRLRLARRAQGPSDGPGIGTALAVGLGAVGLVGLGMYLLNRKGAAEPKFGATEYTIGLEGSAFEPKAQAFRNALEQRGFEITGFGTASRFNGHVIGGDIDVLDPQGTHFDQEEAVARSRKFFKMGDLHGVNVRYVSAGPTGEEKEELGRVGVREFLRQRPKPCIPCGEDSGWEVVKANGDVSLPTTTRVTPSPTRNSTAGACGHSPSSATARS